MASNRIVEIFRYVLCAILLRMIAGMSGKQGRHNGCWCPNSLPWWRYQMQKNPRYWTFVRGIQRSTVNYPEMGQWRGALTFSLICPWANSWTNTGAAGDLWRHRAQRSVWHQEGWGRTPTMWAIIVPRNDWNSNVYFVPNHHDNGHNLNDVNNLALTTPLPIAIASLISCKKDDDAL